MSHTFVFLFAFAIGIVAGLRSLTALAVTALAANRGWIVLLGTPLAFLGSTLAVIVFIVLAAAELVADKLPKTPPRTAPVSLTARILLGGLSGAAIAAAGGQPYVIGAILGALGGVVGAFVGYQARTRLVKAVGIPDFYVAISEDIVAILVGLVVVAHFKI